MRRKKYVSEIFNCAVVYIYIYIYIYWYLSMHWSYYQLVINLSYLTHIYFNFVNFKDDEFLIKWSGCPLSSCTWEQSDHLSEELVGS